MSTLAKQASVVAAFLAAFLAAGPAAAATYPVSGEQTVVSEADGTYKMTGGLVGSWKTTSFKEIATSPLFRAKGTERFKGCLDVGRDGSCAGDPSGGINFRFLYWGKFGPGDSLIWGSCWHPVIGGTGDFAGADGVLTMVDTPSGSGVSTSYTGNITIGGAHRARSASVSRTHCG